MVFNMKGLYMHGCLLIIVQIYFSLHECFRLTQWSGVGFIHDVTEAFLANRSHVSPVGRALGGSRLVVTLPTLHMLHSSDWLHE